MCEASCSCIVVHSIIFCLLPLRLWVHVSVCHQANISESVLHIATRIRYITTVQLCQFISFRVASFQSLTTIHEVGEPM